MQRSPLNPFDTFSPGATWICYFWRVVFINVTDRLGETWKGRESEKYVGQCDSTVKRKQKHGQRDREGADRQTDTQTDKKRQWRRGWGWDGGMGRGGAREENETYTKIDKNTQQNVRNRTPTKKKS